MTTLIAVAYPDEGRAAEVLSTLRTLQKEYLLDLEDAVIVTKDQAGRFKLHQSLNLTTAGAADGAFWGFLVGMIFTLPFPFIAPAAWLGISALTAGIGAAAGAIGGHFSDYGIDDRFVKDLSGSMQPSSSALFVLVRNSTPDKVLPEVGKYGGAVLRTNLSTEAEARLRAALNQQQTAQATAQPVIITAAGA
jgi:uncharacterized membrane protein